MILRLTEDNIQMPIEFLENATEEEITEMRSIFRMVKNRIKEKQK